MFLDFFANAIGGYFVSFMISCAKTAISLQFVSNLSSLLAFDVIDSRKRKAKAISKEMSRKRARIKEEKE